MQKSTNTRIKLDSSVLISANSRPDFTPVEYVSIFDEGESLTLEFTSDSIKVVDELISSLQAISTRLHNRKQNQLLQELDSLNFGISNYSVVQSSNELEHILF